MKINEDKEINNLIKQYNINNHKILDKIFNYHYNILKGNKGISIFFLYILMIIETIQFISYSFTPLHYDSWKMEEKTINIISDITGIFRLSILFKYGYYNYYCFVFYIFMFNFFFSFLIMVILILFDYSLSKFYNMLIKYIRYEIQIFTIAFYIPILELFLIPIKCDKDKIYGIINSKNCWKTIHYLEIVLGIISSILFFLLCFFSTYFNFYPFQKNNSTTRINSNNDIKILIIKIIIVLQNLLITNEYLSLAILLVSSIYIFICCYLNPSYSNDSLENFINIKNLVIIWTYVILLISKFYKNVATEGYIFLLIFGYPFIIYFGNLLYNEKDMNFSYFSDKGLNLKSFIKKTKYNIKLINSFIEKNANFNSNKSKRNLLLLNGNIAQHIKICPNKDCPLLKFVKNEGNFNIQKQCLLNYMNIFFQRALKKFPNNFDLLILFIEFNYYNSFNLNNVKSNFIELNKNDWPINKKFILYIMTKIFIGEKKEYETNLINQNFHYNYKFIQQKFQRLKNLIEKSTKLYAEFWGIFSSNITNKINFKKLYSLGEQLNINLTEINNLWENELKIIKIDSEFQNIVLLYSEFLSEILWDKKKFKEVLKKSKETNLEDLYLIENKNAKEEYNNKDNNLESLLNNQDFLIFSNYEEKGNTKIVNISESLSIFLGYEKQELIGKSLENIYPNILTEIMKKKIKQDIKDIKSMHYDENKQKNLIFKESDNSNNVKSIIIKLRRGYILPIACSIKISESNDYSEDFFIRIRMENRQEKYDYSYYILTNLDLSIENISSSAIHLGLSLDLLKKYNIKIDNLIRKMNGRSLNILEKYHDFEEEGLPVKWVFPDVIYPKDDEQQNRNRKKKKKITEKGIKIANNTNKYR